MTEVSNLIEGARERAKQYSKENEVVGLISRVVTVSHGEEEKEVKADIPFEVYLKKKFLVGSYIGISLPIPGTLMLGRIKAVERADILAVSKVPSLSPSEDSSGLATPLTVTVELLSEKVEDEVVPPSSPVDPQSPIFIPNESFIKEMLGLPDNGISIGNIMEGYRKLNVPIMIPHEVLRHHMLVVGTTGAGKTNLLKLIMSRANTPLIVFDIQGDFVRPMAKMGGNILVPVPRDYSMKVVDFVNVFLKRSGLIGYKIKDVNGNKIEMENDKGESFTLYLIGFHFRKTYDILADVSPFFSVQAAYFFKLATRNCNTTIDQWEEKCSDVLGNFKLHSSTRDNIFRSIIQLRESGIVDVKMGNVTLDEPNYVDLLQKRSVLDLRWVTETSINSATMSAFVIVERLFHEIDKRYKEKGETTPFLMIFDEAHEYFPQGGREEGEKESLERLINRILRLGRVRGIGVIFATHKPQDLNDLVLTLTNSKIALRADEDALEKIDMKEYAKLLQASPPGYGVLRTFSLKVNDLIFRSEKYEE
ncbi:DUF853 family protein [Acidianus sulfidivorans JP7]|uniref:AAA family ATPase n=1 Tax=Acidianus sulfidivorans JP7 TaxID=619593 RepID=A0A2U9IJB9_9CREN|nr:ATP-binding protein [Acidianus sulfidivorans]AWR96123.1 DUF853 family protein [Acidianus sulfidivorans JP7]